MKLHLLIYLASFNLAFTHLRPSPKSSSPKAKQSAILTDCATPVAQTDLSINNVRARLTTGGDLWWNGQYIVPKVDPASGQQEVSAINASGLWLGGIDPGGNLKTACQTYGRHNDNFDFWPGPLTDRGDTKAETCLLWDQFFKITRASIKQHQANWQAAQDEGRTALNPDEISDDIKGWPALGNLYFEEVHGFPLPAPNIGFNGLANFWDVGGTPGIYEPQFGDFPVMEVRGCGILRPLSIPDEMIFWVFNDGGGEHRSSHGEPINMEIHAHAFAYSTNDQIDDMTFYSYRLINRAIEDIDSMHIALWVDPGLGCYLDDYIGCDTSRNLAYFYNSDEVDGIADCNDCSGYPSYCSQIPAVGIDILRGPLNEYGEELGMSSFTYYGFFESYNGIGDPLNSIEYYRYMTGSWRDGTPYTRGKIGYSPNSTNYTKYAYPSPPDDPLGWSLCTFHGTHATLQDDYSFVQSSGPFKLKPGAINEVIYGVIYTPDMDYPCPDMTRFFQTDDLAQACFDNCFDLFLGPWAPDVDWVELDKELVAVLSNKNPLSTNYHLSFEEQAPKAPGYDSTSRYHFEGYQVFQIRSKDDWPLDFSDPDQARLVAKVDIQNGIKNLYNWYPIDNPNSGFPGEPKAIWQPVEQVAGEDQGLRHSFQIREDQFAIGDRTLINHRDYYFSVIAYAYNNWQTFSQKHGLPEGQRKQYLPSRNNIHLHRVTPRPIVDVQLNAKYGDGPQITRLEGAGIGGNFVEITEESKADILDGSFDGSLVYKTGQGPINIEIYNPLEIQDGQWKLLFKDKNLNDQLLEKEAIWELVNLNTNEIISSTRSIEKLNEQIIGEHGFSISIAQTPDAGDLHTGNGVLGIEVEYSDPNGAHWFVGIPDTTPPFDWIKTGSGEIDSSFDPGQDFNTLLSPRYWQPYSLADFRAINNGNFLLSPAWDNPIRQPQVRARSPLQTLNNIDIVLTPDKSKWSRCIVVETASRLFYDTNIGSGKPTEGATQMMHIRKAPSVGKNDSDGDGLPDPDGSLRDGFGWFPGYAIDVETGERLNIFFGENSTYDCAALQEVGLADYCDRIPSAGGGKGIGRDMFWNPTADLFVDIDTQGDPLDIYPFIAGGQHFIYATRQAYDGCDSLYTDLITGSSFRMVTPLSQITWTCMPLVDGEGLLPLGNSNSGLIPNEVTFKLRVDNPYQVASGNGENNAHPAYLFSFNGVEKKELTTAVEIEEELDQINVVPNPYYGYSYYENSDADHTVKITNLPPKCTLTIYSLDGRLIRKYHRNERTGTPNGSGIASQQINPALEWDLKDRKGNFVAGGAYLIHLNVKDKGERVLKFFMVQRE